VYKSEYFRKNLKFLRKERGLKQDEMQDSTGISGSTWSDYERGKSKPDIEQIVLISELFQVTADDLLRIDIEVDRANVHLIEKSEKKKSDPIVHPIVHLNKEKDRFNQDLKVTIVAEDGAKYGEKLAHIPVVDISVAAGAGYYNDGHIETEDAVHLPINFVKRGHTYLCVKIKGISMAPTLQDGGWVVIRQLDRGDWAKMPDECVYVVVDREGKSYLNRIKNRFKKGFIVLRSDSPDRASYPSFNIEEKDIAAIWYAEMYFTHKMPNIHDQFYTRLQDLEDKVDILANQANRINPK
jgi:transcriptional regulator with XRE-family HTH domain